MDEQFKKSKNDLLKASLENGWLGKYYVPSIEECHIGLEYEYYQGPLRYETGPGKWVKSCIESYFFGTPSYGPREGGEAPISELWDQINRNEIRVKHLHQSDIEELGWKPVGKTEFGEPIFRLPHPIIPECIYELRFGNGYIYIICQVRGSWENRNDIMKFVIKNKSRLKLLMEMIGV